MDNGRGSHLQRDRRFIRSGGRNPPLFYLHIIYISCIINISSKGVRVYERFYVEIAARYA